MTYTNSILYVFSGTGNTHKIAQTTRDYFQSHNVQTEIISINDNCISKPVTDTQTLVAYMFPSHGFMPPWSVIKYLFKLPKHHHVPAFCVSTRGAVKFGPVTIPGIAGLATFLTGLILWIKGFKIKGLFSIDMPSNFINFHWGLNKKNVTEISGKGVKKTCIFLKQILEKKPVFLTLNNLWEFSWSLILLYVFPLFPVLYLLIARLSMGKIMFASHQCNSCGLCAKNCPSDAIRMTGRKKAKVPYWTDQCDACMRCMGSCPQKAIEASHIWFILIILITGIPAAGYLLGWISGNHIFTGKTAEYLNYLLAYPVILVMYRVFFILTKITWIKSLFTYLTFTHYYRRFFHPDIKMKELK